MGFFSRHPDPKANDKRPSDWLVTERAKRPGTKACGTCKGTGRSGFVNDKGETITCPDCRGFGY